MIRRIGTWTVLRFSVLFYSSMLIVALVATLLLWGVASSTGLIDNVEELIEELFALDSFAFNAGVVLRSTLVAGVLVVLLGSGLSVLMAVFYNLTADVVGGIEVTVADDEPAQRGAV